MSHFRNSITSGLVAKHGPIMGRDANYLTDLLISAFLNNIPVVIIFIPIVQGIAQRFNVPASKLLMPLSFVAVLGHDHLVGSKPICWCPMR